MVDIQSPTAEIRRRKKKEEEEEERRNRMKIYMVSLFHRATIKQANPISAIINSIIYAIYAKNVKVIFLQPAVVCHFWLSACMLPPSTFTFIIYYYYYTASQH